MEDQNPLNVLLLLTNKVDLSRCTDPKLAEIVDDLPYSATTSDFVMVPKGYLIVKRDSMIFENEVCDLGFLHQQDYHHSDDFYSIPILDSSLSTLNINYDSAIRKGFKGIQDMLKEQGIDLSRRGFSRFLINVYDHEDRKRKYLLYESRDGKLDGIGYDTTDTDQIAEDLGHVQLIEHVQNIEDYFKRISDN